ncbi:MAG: DUF421 domain-containing protein [Elusimicrobia bacterium]|nr:DUF421 domain-containing protein [Elusimicrobiota bacterium]
MSPLWSPSVPLVQLLVRAVLVYVVVLALLRLGGKRQIGQMGAAEFVALLLVSNAVQNAMNGGDNSLGGGLFLAAVLMGLSALVVWLSYRSKRFESLVEGRPCLLVYKGEPLLKNLDAERVPLRELRTLLRRQGVHELKDVHEAVLEANGMLTVVRNSELPPSVSRV